MKWDCGLFNKYGCSFHVVKLLKYYLTAVDVINMVDAFMFQNYYNFI